MYEKINSDFRAHFILPSTSTTEGPFHSGCRSQIPLSLDSIFLLPGPSSFPNNSYEGSRLAPVGIEAMCVYFKSFAPAKNLNILIYSKTFYEMVGVLITLLFGYVITEPKSIAKQQVRAEAF